ncbi:uncharacterized protein LOC122624726 isoform X2 [Drosophila teissieri]|uniref:uncharacterized protein LOC122624726 isoform X2 n=1 Tax=Drosophila teissieri TaxID=7243 RepID=UPI001CB9E210|nr:uncharacterized protein LOC122624726 isoform X2 [Drosophila teissieri]
MAIKLHFFVAFLMFTTYFLTEVCSLVEFTNVKCESLDKDFALFEYCYLKSVNRTYKYCSLKVKLLKLPVTKVKVRFGLYQRLNGYKPFLYNMTIDACRFIKAQNPNPIALFFYNLFKEYSNHDVLLDKMPYHFINNKLTKVLPFPEGNYMFKMEWIAYDINRAVTEFFWSLT